MVVYEMVKLLGVRGSTDWKKGAVPGLLGYSGRGAGRQGDAMSESRVPRILGSS